MIQKNIFGAVIFFAAFVMGVQFYYSIDMPRTAARQVMHADFIANNPDGAFHSGNDSNLRVLTPFLVEAAIRFFHQFMSYQRAFLLSFGLFDIAAIFFSLSACFRYLLIWFQKNTALNIVLFASILWMFTFKNQTYHPWSLIEFGLFSLGLLYAYQKRFLAFLAVFALATFNRNTSVFLIPAFFFANISLPLQLRGRKKFLMEIGALFLVYFCIMYVLSAWRAFPSNLGLLDVVRVTWKSNMQVRNLTEGAINAVLFFLPVLSLVFSRFREKPPYLKRVALSAALYLPFYICFMRWLEIRGLIIVLPFLLPLLFVPDKADAISEAVV